MKRVNPEALMYKTQLSTGLLLSCGFLVMSVINYFEHSSTGSVNLGFAIYDVSVVLPVSIALLAGGLSFINHGAVRILLVLVVNFAGYTIMFINEPINLTWLLFHCYSILLAFRFNFFKRLGYSLIYFWGAVHFIIMVILGFILLEWSLQAVIAVIFVSYFGAALVVIPFKHEVSGYEQANNRLKEDVRQYQDSVKNLDGKVERSRVYLEKLNVQLNQKVKDLEEKETALETSLHERELLTREITHRVKNTLAVLSSLINLQQSEVEDPEVLKHLDVFKHRIFSMAAVHESVFNQDVISLVNMQQVTEQLLFELLDDFPQSPYLRTDIAMGTLDVSVSQATPCALVISEIIGQSIENAPEFKEIKVITVRGSRKDETGEISISFPWKQSGVQSRDRYMRNTMIETVINGQLKGDYEISRKNGTTWRVHFPISAA